MKYSIPLSLVLALPLANAATLLRTGPTATGVSAVDLTSVGSTNWAAWNSRSNPDNAPSADFFMSGATGTISEMSRTTGSGVRGTDNTATYPANVFTWTNGNDNTVPEKISGIFTTVDQTAAGIQFSITDLPSLGNGQAYHINIYASAYRGTNEITASNGTLDQTISGILKGDTKNVELYQFFYNPDDESDILTISSILSVDTGTTAHALINAVAISVIPEPSSPLLVAGSLLGLFGIRRR